MTPLSKDIIDALHADGYHVVTRQEWYATQVRIGELETALEEIDDPAYCGNFAHERIQNVLSSTPGGAVAKRMAALERVAEAAKEFTSTWGRSKGGLFYRDPEIPGTTIALMEALEEMDT